MTQALRGCALQGKNGRPLPWTYLPSQLLDSGKQHSALSGLVRKVHSSLGRHFAKNSGTTESVTGRVTPMEHLLSSRVRSCTECSREWFQADLGPQKNSCWRGMHAASDAAARPTGECTCGFGGGSGSGCCEAWLKKRATGVADLQKQMTNGPLRMHWCSVFYSSCIIKRLWTNQRVLKPVPGAKFASIPFFRKFRGV